MKKVIRLLRLWALSLIIFSIICVGLRFAVKQAIYSWLSWETASVRDHLPENLETTGFAQTSSDLELWTLLLPIRHEACGGALLKLDPAILQKIDGRGLRFLETARRSKRSHGSRYPEFDAWDATPVPKAYFHENLLAGTECMRLKADEVSALQLAATTPGSFYTHDRDRLLLVIPAAGVVLVTYEH